MTKLTPLTPKALIKILIKLGFSDVRSKGSHHFFFNAKTNKTTVVPIHGNETIGIGLLKEILRDIELPTEEYECLRREM